MTIYRFAYPLAFQLLWIVPILLALTIAVMTWQRRRLSQPFDHNLLEFLSSSVSTQKRRWKLGLELLTIILMIVALARPQSGQSQQKIKSEGVELMLLVDVSQSMLTEDVKPSRLELAKASLERFIDMGGGDRIGVVAFAGSAALLSPLTPDKSAIKMYLDSLDPDSVSTQGTDFAEALKTAQGAFKRGGVTADADAVVTHAVIMISDGEDNEKGALQEAEKLRKQGTHIFTLAVGTAKGGPIPVRDERGVLRGYHKDRNGKVVLSQTHDGSLEAVAKAGGGSFYHVTFGDDSMRRLRQDIDHLQKTLFSSQEVSNYDEKYQIFLFFAILLALIELSLGERRRFGRLWRGRFEVPES